MLLSHVAPCWTILKRPKWSRGMVFFDALVASTSIDYLQSGGTLAFVTVGPCSGLYCDAVRGRFKLLEWAIQQVDLGPSCGMDVKGGAKRGGIVIE